MSMLLLSACVLAGQGGTSEIDKSRIISLENAWNQAQWQKDATALHMLLAPSLVYVDYDGSLKNKAEYVASVTSASVHPARIVSESMEVHVDGMVAIVSGICRENGVRYGKPYSVRMRYTDTWIKRNDTWTCIASQSTLIE